MFFWEKYTSRFKGYIENYVKFTGKNHLFYHETPQKLSANYLGFLLLLIGPFQYWHYINL